MSIFLTLLSGIGWMIVYEECIRIGIKQKTYAMPFWALSLNITWEVIYSYSDIFLGAHGPLEGITIAQAIVNVFWVFLDCIILYTYFKYGKKDWPKKLSEKLFIPWSLLIILCSALLQFAFIYEFGFVLAAMYSAFLQNLLMSILFIHMFFSRKGTEGQSLLLAIAKWIGTLAPTILMGVIEFNIIVLIVGLFCSVFDIIYIILLMKEKGISWNHIFFKIAWKILGRKELYIDKNVCVKCGTCYKICSHDSIIQNTDKSFDIHSEKCHRCYHCLENCPKKAIKTNP